MKLVMFYVHEWWYRTALKSLSEIPDMEKEELIRDAVVIFYHSEEADEVNRDGIIQKFVKNTKWIAGKFKTKNVVLHSFNHLSTSKSSPEFAHALLIDVVEKLRKTSYTVMTTPFGYFNEFKMHVAGDSLAKVYKEF